MTEPELQPIDEQQLVIEFLTNHPDWLLGQPELLTKIELHGKKSGIISLADRQLQQLREENKLLKKDLSDFVSNARNNEELLHKIFKLCIALLYEPDLIGLNDHLKTACSELFNIDQLRLFLFNGDFPEQFMVSGDLAKEALGDYLPKEKVVTGRLRHAERTFLFSNPDQVASVAIVPIKGNEISGILALGSHDEQHFAPENGDLFLSLFGKTLNLWLTQHNA